MTQKKSGKWEKRYAVTEEFADQLSEDVSSVETAKINENLLPKQPKYGWEPDAKFIIEGKDVELIMAVLSTYMQQQSTQEVLAMARVYEAMTGVFKRGIDDGIVTDKNKPLE